MARRPAVVIAAVLPAAAGADEKLRRPTLADKTLDVLRRFVGGQGTANDPCWSPDGRRIALATYQ